MTLFGISRKEMKERLSWQETDQCWIEERLRNIEPLDSPATKRIFTRLRSLPRAFVVWWLNSMGLQ